MLDEPDRLGRDGQRADRLVVAGVADVEDRVALPGADLGLVVHLGHERADRVDHEALRSPAPRLTTSGAEPWAESISGRAGGHVVDVVHEDHAQLLEALDDEPVVDDLVVAVDGRLEDAHHPRQRLDRHLDAGAEAAGWARRTFDGHDGKGNGAMLRASRAERPGEGAGARGPAVPDAPMPSPQIVAVAPGGLAAGGGRRAPGATRC